ncbi:ABC transporter ATP-binding protein [Rhodopirellula sp. JC639]|uniref:ABC transporter ATP-binding protein n=1 Tax=Stieleria mannarensis TaxID=2755585 RepID=UPI001C71F989|nr:ABC transporter ATP-binding protein [Rhodopirellula sp. JC639]
MIAEPDRVEDGHFWALRDINFRVGQGEVVGVIGKNGAGKSTLLKLLSRITYPTEGRVELFGRVASLLEVGTGFHPELTGRENVFLNGTILGMTRREVREQLDAIVEFAGVEKFLDTPVKRYSSGMKVRLGFAVAAHLDPEILIVDEVLAVGDIEFQKRCLGKMKSVAESGKTVLFVSHNLASIRSLTTRTVVLSHGRLIFDGPTQQGVTKYVEENLIGEDSDVSIADAPRAFSGLDQKLRFTDLRLAGLDESGCLPMTGEFAMEAAITAHDDCEKLQVAITVMTDDKTPVGSTFSEILPAPEKGQTKTYPLVSHFNLAPGRYHCAISITDFRSAATRLHDSLSDVLPFGVGIGALSGSGGPAHWNPAWGMVQLQQLNQVRSDAVHSCEE